VVGRPFGFTFPLSAALVTPTDVAASVVTAGGLPGDAVEKLMICPSEYPPLFSAQTRKWYVVPGAKTLKFVLTDRSINPFPASCLGELEGA
jgi:hypothetical protein